jgi:hypothetical protein
MSDPRYPKPNRSPLSCEERPPVKSVVLRKSGAYEVVDSSVTTVC